ncbi:MAG: pyridoxine 5'-phosphate synthase [Chloroflexia bacterium]|nr:pyridoxine 5'-phosphate synthase [Chloroflexia bacterium]
MSLDSRIIMSSIEKTFLFIFFFLYFSCRNWPSSTFLTNLYRAFAFCTIIKNLKFYQQHVTGLLEVSIGQALICDALYYGLSNTIVLYLHQLQSFAS